MSISPTDVEAVVAVVASHPSVTSSGVHFAQVSEAQFHEISPGVVAWQWGDRTPKERGLRAALAYFDLDGSIVGVVVITVENQVTQIELMRGDAKPILSVPQQGDLWEMVPGQLYSPRK